MCGKDNQREQDKNCSASLKKLSVYAARRRLSRVTFSFAAMEQFKC